MDTLQQLLNRFPVTVVPGQKVPIDVPAMSRESLAQVFGDLHLNVGAEIGVERGEFTEVLMKHNPKLKLYAIDAWQHYRGYRDHVNQQKLDGFYASTLERMKKYPGCQVVKGWSMDVVRDFPEGSLDFVYIDGNHSFDWVMQDVIEWSRRVRRGGIVSGHDFIRRRREHVVQAIQTYTHCHDIGVWFTTGGEGESRSWFWVRP